MRWAAERPTTSALTLEGLRRERDRARTEYLTAARTSCDTAERGRRWRRFLEANAAYELRAKGDSQ